MNESVVKLFLTNTSLSDQLLNPVIKSLNSSTVSGSLVQALTTMSTLRVKLDDGDYVSLSELEREDSPQGSQDNNSTKDLIDNLGAGIFAPIQDGTLKIDYGSSSASIPRFQTFQTPNSGIHWSGNVADGAGANGTAYLSSTSVQVYIICILGVLPAAVGGALWWAKSCKQRKNSNNKREPEQSDNDFPADQSWPPDIGRRSSAISIGGVTSLYGYCRNPGVEMSPTFNQNIQQPASHLSKLYSGLPFEPGNMVANRFYEGSLSSRISPDDNASNISCVTNPNVNNLGGKTYSNEISKNMLEMDRLLGEGNFGQVWRARMHPMSCPESGIPPPMEVAVKTTKLDATETEAESLLSELDIMLALKYHPNVIQVFACCTKVAPYYIIMEFASPGRLLDVLRSHRREVTYYSNYARKGSIVSMESNPSLLTQNVLSAEDLIHFVLDIAKGMAFIHSRNIIHRDLAARNILVSRKLCKISDFGLARKLPKRQEAGEPNGLVEEAYEQKSRGALPLRWMAPESLEESLFSKKSDVWSFGVLLWEIATLGATPYPGLSSKAVVTAVKNGQVMDRPAHCGAQLYELMKCVWRPASEERPPFKALVERVEQMLEQHVGYIDLDSLDKSPLPYYNMVSEHSDEHEEKL